MMLKNIFKRQEIRFLFVGGLNTLVGYGLYAIFLMLNVNYLIANTLSTILGVLHSYLWNRFFTFKSKEKAGKEIVKFVSVYIISYLLGTATLFCFTSLLQLSPYIAGFINLFITTLISFFGHKYFSFRKEPIKMEWWKSQKPLKIEWIVLGIIGIFLFLTFLFPDILITTNASIIFDDLFFQGNLKDLYAATYQNLPGIFAGTNITYDFPIYIFFGLWNIPLFLYTKVTGLAWETSYFNLLYAKAFLIVLTILSLVVINKILKLFDIAKDDRKMYTFLFVSSALVLMVITMFAGYDILAILFTLLGIYYYLKDDHKKFLFFFAIATSLKLFALFLFVPLLLLKEKKILKILLNLLGAVSLVLFAKIIYWNAPMYQISMSSFEDNMFQRLNGGLIATPLGNISIFITCYVLICCWCYHKNFTDKKLFNLYTMYIGLGVYGLFTIFCQIHPQWTILMMPYLIFFLVYNKQDRKLNILLEMAFTACTLLTLYMVYTWVFTTGLTDHMLFEQIFNLPTVTTGLPILERFVPYQSIINAVVLATFVYFMWINKPEKLLKQEKSEKWEHGLLCLRMSIIVPFALLIVYYYFR